LGRKNSQELYVSTSPPCSLFKGVELMTDWGEHSHLIPSSDFLTAFVRSLGHVRTSTTAFVMLTGLGHELDARKGA
jgi:hypothetical protein